MNQRLSALMLCLPGALLSGCNSTAPSAPQTPTTIQTTANGLRALPGPRVAHPGEYRVARYQRVPGGDNAYRATYTHKRLADYAEQLAMELMQRLTVRGDKAELHIGVASFVELSASLRRTSPLGNKLAESLIAEVQAYGVPVVDYKAMNVVELDAQGDYLFSRQRSRLPKGRRIDYVLAGTIERSGRGATINARIVSLAGGEVIASASGFVPQVVIQDLFPRG